MPTALTSLMALRASRPPAFALVRSIIATASGSRVLLGGNASRVLVNWFCVLGSTPFVSLSVIRLAACGLGLAFRHVIPSNVTVRTSVGEVRIGNLQLHELRP